MKVFFFEIKNRLIFIFILQVSTLVSLYYYKTAILFAVISPILYLGGISHNFIFTGVTEPLASCLLLTYFVNAQLVIMYALYQLFFFLSSGFYAMESMWILRHIKLSTLFLICSSIAANLFLVPWSWLFFLDFYNTTYGVALSTHTEFKLLEYLKFYEAFHWLNFIYFQLTGLLFWWVNSRRMTLKRVRKFRKALFFAFFIFSALICPDVISLFIFVAILIGTYEVSVVSKLLYFR